MKAITWGLIGLFLFLLIGSIAYGAENYTCTNSSTCSYNITNTTNSTDWLNGILLIPLAVAFFFMVFANSFESHEVEDERGERTLVNQEPLRWFFRLLSMFMVLVTYIGANIVIGSQAGYDDLTTIFNITAVNWIFYTTLAIFLIYFIYKIFMSFEMGKKKDFEMGRIK